MENGIIIDVNLDTKSLMQNSLQSLAETLSVLNFDELHSETQKAEDLTERIKEEGPEGLNIELERMLSPSATLNLALDEISGLVENLIGPNSADLIKGMLVMFGQQMPLLARKMAAELRNSHHLHAYPVLTELLSPIQFSNPGESETVPFADIASIVVHSMPQLDDSVPWEQVLDYRTDNESKGKMMALRRWMYKVARTELTPQEIEAELEWLIYDYERHLKLHKMKYKAGLFETVIIPGTAFLENTVKLKFSEAAKSLLTLRHTQIALLEAEMNTPGSEVAYIVETRERFS